MTFTKPAQVIICCGIFLLAFFLTSSIDFPLTLAVATYLLLSGSRYLPLFVFSIIIYILYIILNAFDIHLRFISDLSIDAYILFITGVVIYFKSRKDLQQLVKKIITNKEKPVSKQFIQKGLISIVLVLLLFPIIGGYLSVFSSYIIFSILINQSNGKVAVAVSLVFLFFAAIFVLFNKTLIAEELGNYTYFFLVIGSIQEVVNLVRRGRESKEEKLSDLLVDKDLVSIEFKRISFRKFSLPRLPRVNPRIIIVIISFILLLVLSYFLLPHLSRLPKLRLSFSMPKIRLSLPRIQFPKPVPSPTPTIQPTAAPTIIPTATPTPVTKVSSESAKLKVFVQNGTEIQGLAATTSAILKKVGFIEINIGNAVHQDYTNWQITMKKKNESLIPLFKNILQLTDLKYQEATMPAGFDILIIAGKQK